MGSTSQTNTSFLHIALNYEFCFKNKTQKCLAPVVKSMRMVHVVVLLEIVTAHAFARTSVHAVTNALHALVSAQRTPANAPTRLLAVVAIAKEAVADEMAMKCHATPCHG